VEEAPGSGRFAGVYLDSGILGAALSMYSCIVTGEMYVSAGASGAIYGLMGSLAVLILLHRGRFKGLSIQRMGFMLALCVYQSVTSMGIDTMGHLGGLISGMVLTMLLYGISYLAGWEN
jgi:rhomboid protease GluP